MGGRSKGNHRGTEAQRKTKGRKILLRAFFNAVSPISSHSRVMRIQKINHREHREHRGITEKIIFARSAVYSLFSVSISVFSVFSVVNPCLSG